MYHLQSSLECFFVPLHGVIGVAPSVEPSLDGARGRRTGCVVRVRMSVCAPGGAAAGCRAVVCEVSTEIPALREAGIRFGKTRAALARMARSVDRTL